MGINTSKYGAGHGMQDTGYMRHRFILHPASCILHLTLVLIFALPSSSHAQERLRLATTTSVQDSGLMPYLLQVFEKRCGCKVDVIAVGSGQALKLAINGDVDMVIVHDPAAEKQFLEDGWGINHKTFMMNDFVILGPQSDPARIKGMKSAASRHSPAFKRRTHFLSLAEMIPGLTKESWISGRRPGANRHPPGTWKSGKAWARC